MRAARAFPSDSAVLAIIRQRVEDKRSAGIVIGLLEPDGRTRVVAYGDPGPGRPPLDGNSVFEIGSISKVFTSTVLAQLVQEGKVKLDDPVQQYLQATVQRTAIELPAATLARYVGTYGLASDFALEVTMTDGALWAQVTGQGKLRLWAEAETEFYLKEVDAQLTFVRDSAGEVTSLVLHQNGQHPTGKKVRQDSDCGTTVATHALHNHERNRCHTTRARPGTSTMRATVRWTRAPMPNRRLTSRSRPSRVTMRPRFASMTTPARTACSKDASSTTRPRRTARKHASVKTWIATTTTRSALRRPR